MTDLAVIPKESPKAAAAFLEYADLGPGRSLAKLAVKLGKKPGYVRQLEEWSSWYGWQDRLAHMALAKADVGNGYRADTWVAITKKYHQIVVIDEPNGIPVKLDALNSIYDRVKPEQAAALGLGVHITLAFYDRPDGPQ